MYQCKTHAPTSIVRLPISRGVAPPSFTNEKETPIVESNEWNLLYVSFTAATTNERLRHSGQQIFCSGLQVKNRQKTCAKAIIISVSPSFLDESLRLCCDVLCGHPELFQQLRRRTRVPELVPHAHAVHGDGSVLCRDTCNRLAEPADDIVFLDGDDPAAFFRRTDHKLFIHRLDRCHVDDACLDSLGSKMFSCLHCLRHKNARSYDGNIRPILQDFSLANGK